MTLHTTWKSSDKGHIAEHNEIARRLKSVKDYGAVGNGVMDCAAAFQAAMPNIVVPPDGGYSFEHGITAGQFLSLSGPGRESANLYGRATLDGALLTLTKGAFHIKDIMFVMQNGEPAIEGSAVLNDGLIEGCWFTGTGQAGPLFACFGNNLTVSGCAFELATRGVRFSGGSSSYIGMSGCIFYGITNTALEFEKADCINLSNLFIEARGVEDITASAIVFRNCGRVNLSNVVFSKVWDAPAESFAHAIRFENCDYVNMSNVITEGFASGTPFEIVNSTRINV